MSDREFRHIGLIACIALVVLRLAIGWQLLYEGLWKINSQYTAKPWTAEPYLKNAQGPLRQYFRDLSGDPDDLYNLDYNVIEARWIGWSERFKNHYQLDDTQKRIFDTMVKGSDDFRAVLEQLPEGVEFRGSLGKAVKFLEKEQRLVVDGEQHLTPREKQAMLALVDFREGVDDLDQVEDPVKKKYIKAVQEVYQRQARLSFLEQAKATLMGDPELVGTVDAKNEGTIDGIRLGKIDTYRGRLARYEQNLAKARTRFDYDHLAYDWKEIQGLRAELVAPIKSLEADMKWKAEKLLTTKQLAKGPLPEQWDSQRDIDFKTMWALTIIGGLLIAGLGTRIAALAGAFLLFNFYMAYPPIPGYPDPPGVEHAVIVNKVLVEVLVLLAFVFLPTGRWFGIDAIFAGLFLKEKDADRV